MVIRARKIGDMIVNPRDPVGVAGHNYQSHTNRRYDPVWLIVPFDNDIRLVKNIVTRPYNCICTWAPHMVGKIVMSWQVKFIHNACPVPGHAK